MHDASHIYPALELVVLFMSMFLLQFLLFLVFVPRIGSVHRTKGVTGKKHVNIDINTYRMSNTMSFNSRVYEMRHVCVLI
jgi:hypothetical protein